jgi:hypothetical protein
MLLMDGFRSVGAIAEHASAKYFSAAGAAHVAWRSTISKSYAPFTSIHWMAD